MPIIRRKHRRVILTDFTGGTYDVQNDARCASPNPRACTGVCPRHAAPAYADQQARHATDSIPPLDMQVRVREGSTGWIAAPSEQPFADADRAERYHTFGITR